MLWRKIVNKDGKSRGGEEIAVLNKVIRDCLTEKNFVCRLEGKQSVPWGRRLQVRGAPWVRAHPVSLKDS